MSGPYAHGSIVNRPQTAQVDVRGGLHTNLKGEIVSEKKDKESSFDER